MTATPELPSGTVTFLFTDIEGSTRLLQELGDRYAAVLETSQRLIRRAVEGGEGIEVSTEGDSFFCAFPTAPGAIAAAVQAQSALATHPWPAGHSPWVRMGLHTGEAVLGGDSYVGLDVHRAARIASAGHGGQVLISDATLALVQQALPSGVGIRDLGSHRLKDLAQPEHIYQLTIEGLPSDFPTLRTRETAPSNLPTFLTSFIGREDELASIRSLLSANRLVTLTGPGGAGKTRLAGRVGDEVERPDGAWFVPLGVVAQPELVAKEVASALAVHEQADRPIEETLISHLGGKDAWVILDNCEHLVAAVSRLSVRLLTECPNVTLLATSREALGVEGEQIFRVGSLRVPAQDEQVDAERLLEFEAVALFVERARAVAPEFDPTSSAETCAEICRRLDGIPLAIELAAARAALLTAGEILSRLEDRFALLTSRSRTALPRHETLEAAIDWSYALLSNEEQALLRRLSVFRGGFTLHAAEEICTGDGLESGQVIDLISALIDKSLVNSDTAAGSARYYLLETIREYGALQLKEASEFDAVARLHTDWFTEWASAQAHLLRTRDQLEALDRLEDDHDNLRAVIARAHAGKDAHAAVELAGALAWFWYLHAHFTEAERWFALLLEGEPEAVDRAWGRLLIGAAEFDTRNAKHDRAEERLRRAIDAARKMGSRRLEMWGQTWRATNAWLTLDTELAITAAQDSASIAEEVGDFGALAWARFLLLGFEAWQTLRTDETTEDRAARVYTDLVPITDAARAVGERNTLGHMLQLAGSLAAAADEDHHASADCDEAIVAFSELATVSCACHCLEAIAEYAVGRDHPNAAVRLLAAAEQLRAEVGIITPPLEQDIRDEVQAACEGLLEPPDFAAAWEVGAAFGLAEAVALSRETLRSQ